MTDISEILLLTLSVSGAALVIGGLAGTVLALAIGLYRFPGRALVILLVQTGFAFPPVVMGLMVYMLISRSGPLGSLNLLFTPTAMIIAQSLLVFPYVAGIGIAAFHSVPAELDLQARALGASKALAVWMRIREARLGFATAWLAGFGAAISEVGSVLLVGGNISGETRVLTTSIMLETRRGNFDTAILLGVILLGLALLVNGIAFFIGRSTLLYGKGRR